MLVRARASLSLSLSDSPTRVERAAPRPPFDERVTGIFTRSGEDLRRWSQPVAGRRIRGIAVRAFVQWYEVELGTPRFHALLTRFPRSLAASFNLAAEGLGVRAHEWYADTVVAALLDALTGHLSDTRRSHVALRAARVVMRSKLSGAKQTRLSWIGSPERYASHAQQVWNAYYDSGSLRIRARSDFPGAICSVRGFRAHHPLLCELNAGASTAIYENMGKKHVSTTRVACVGLGHEECRFATLWRA